MNDRREPNEADRNCAGGCYRGCFRLGAGVCDGVVNMAALEVELGPESLAAIRSLTEALRGLKGTPAAEGGEELLSRKEAAEFLGIAPSTFRAWILAGLLPDAIELSERNQRWKKSDLLAFAAKRRSAA